MTKIETKIKFVSEVNNEEIGCQIQEMNQSIDEFDESEPEDSISEWSSLS